MANHEEWGEQGIVLVRAQMANEMLTPIEVVGKALEGRVQFAATDLGEQEILVYINGKEYVLQVRELNGDVPANEFTVEV